MNPKGTARERGRVQLEKGQRAAAISSVVTALLALTKGLVGFLSGSVALIADALHSFSDIFASLAVWLGLKLSRREPTEKFPYGYYRAENLASLVVSIVIIITGVGILLESYDAFMHPRVLAFPFLGLAVAAVSAMVSFGLSVYKKKVAEEIKSQALAADAKHSLSDTLSSVIVFIGISASMAGVPGAEGIVGALIAAFVMLMGVLSSKDAILALMDAWTDPGLEKQVARYVKGVRGVRGIHQLKLRKSGSFIMGEAHVEVDRTLPVERANEIRKAIESEVKEKVEKLDSLLLQLEPSKLIRFRVAVPVVETKGLTSAVGGHFGKAPYFAFVDVEGGKVKKTTVLKNPAAKLDRRIGVEVANFLLDNKAEVLVALGIGESPFHILKSKFVRIFQSEGETLREVLENLLEDKLKEHKEPERK